MWLDSVRREPRLLFLLGAFDFLWLGLRDGADDRSCGGNEMRIKTQSAAF